MKRRVFLAGLTAAATLVAATGQAYAATYADDVVAQLARQGYSGIAIDTTWLGRVRILGNRSGSQREIILNPRTGEILRDTLISTTGDSARKPIIDDVEMDDDDNSGSGSDSSGGSGDDGNDDSGSSGGGDSSGSGSGGSDDSSDDDSSDDDSSDDSSSGADDSGGDDSSGKGSDED